MTSRFTGIIFDMDGTITRPVLDFALIRAELDIPDGDLLEEINRRPENDRRAAWAVVEQHEENALERLEMQDHAVELLHRCKKADLKLGLLTRNLRRSVDYICERFDLVFDSIVTREFEPPKPHPGPVLHILGAWQIEPAQAMMVGDYLHDIDCGNAAGCQTCFFQNDGKPFFGQDADYTVRSMHELETIVFEQRQ